jgi:hypothetical protein
MPPTLAVLVRRVTLGKSANLWILVLRISVPTAVVTGLVRDLTTQTGPVAAQLLIQVDVIAKLENTYYIRKLVFNLVPYILQALIVKYTTLASSQRTPALTKGSAASLPEALTKQSATALPPITESTVNFSVPAPAHPVSTVGSARMFGMIITVSVRMGSRDGTVPLSPPTSPPPPQSLLRSRGSSWPRLAATPVSTALVPTVGYVCSTETGAFIVTARSSFWDSIVRRGKAIEKYNWKKLNMIELCVLGIPVDSVGTMIA